MINANVINGRVYSTSNTIQEKDMQIALTCAAKQDAETIVSVTPPHEHTRFKTR